MKCIILSRVSTESQDLQQQTEAVYKRCLSDGYTKKNIIIIEDKESAVKLTEEQRLGLNELKAIILKDSTINCVYAYEISRIGRRAEVNYSIRNFLKEHRIQLRILNPSIELFDDNFNIKEADNMLFAIFNSMAENEGFIRKQRFKRGRENAKKQGRSTGGIAILGYYIDPKTKTYHIDEEKKHIILRIFNEYASGRTALEIGKDLVAEGYHKQSHDINIKRFVGDILRNEYYKGVFPYPRIIDDELFERCLKHRKTAKALQRNVFSSDKCLCKGILKDFTGKYAFSTSVCIDAYKCLHYGLQMKLSFVDSVAYKEAVEYYKANGDKPVKHFMDLGKKKIKIKKMLYASEKHIEELKEKKDTIWERNIDGKISNTRAEAMSSAVEKQIEDEYKNVIDYNSQLSDINDQLNTMVEPDGTLINKEIDYNSLSSEEKKSIVRQSIRMIRAERFNQYNWALHFEFMNLSTKVVKINTYTKKILS